ncbi:MAG: precorrin-6Y C5,15-methyltransferase (decarboxylating) subunit CbiT [Thermoanaerobacteraceae bacterium]|nr:precorrin-6Y C5,15-methyltransferase (decarboxylating) subunit CbiT [Thermoanaerobacteraceae bacterium]
MNKYVTPGLDDASFVRGNVPMTKEEVRIISLCKLALQPESIVYDIGAGTGSITVEAARLVADGKVFAVEKNREAVQLIRENLSKFNSDNVSLVIGEAPRCLRELPPPDRVFIGGSGGNLKDIIRFVDRRLKPQGRIVANAVTLETAYEVISLLETGNYDVNAVTVSLSKLKKIGKYHMWRAENPVTVIWGIKGGNVSG